MNTDGMHAWPVRLVAHAGEPAEQSYADSSLTGLAERCAGAASEWGTDKTASKVDPVLLFKDPDAHPMPLLLMTIDRYGEESFDWAPEVLRVTMIRDNIQVSGNAFTKIMAARTLALSPSPWRQWHVFHWVARALAGLPPNFSFLEQPEIGHLMVAADIMKLIDPSRPFGTEIDKFTAAALKDAGHVFAPEPLAFAQRELENPQLECGACHALFHDDNDEKCVTCGAAKLHPVPYAWAELRDKCEASFKLHKDLPIVRALDALPDDTVGNLVYQLLVQHDYCLNVRKHLLAQLRLFRR